MSQRRPGWYGRCSRAMDRVLGPFGPALDLGLGAALGDRLHQLGQPLRSALLPGSPHGLAAAGSMIKPASTGELVCFDARGLRARPVGEPPARRAAAPRARDPAHPALHLHLPLAGQRRRVALRHGPGRRARRCGSTRRCCVAIVAMWDGPSTRWSAEHFQWPLMTRISPRIGRESGRIPNEIGQRRHFGHITGPRLVTQEQKKSLISRDVLDGRGWFRTSDLSRVKQSTGTGIFLRYAGESCACEGSKPPQDFPQFPVILLG
jgi:hypothetical protein